MNRLLTPADWIVVVTAAAMLGFIFPALWGASGAATTARIMVGDELYAEVELDHVHDLVVPGAIGDSKLMIEAGKIRFLSSPCRHKVCINRGWLDRAGAATACLPNRISVWLKGQPNPNGEDYDGLAF